jgi:spermidine/putrescine-binding protein
MDRRKFLGASAAALCVSAPFGRALAQGAVEEQLNMMGWADYISPDNIAAWEGANNSRLNYDSYASNDEMYSKLQLSGGNSGYDLGMNTDYMIRLLIDNKLIQPIDRSLVPNLANALPGYAPLFWSKGLSWNANDEAAFKDAEVQVEALAKHIRTFNSYPIQDVASGATILAQC